MKGSSFEEMAKMLESTRRRPKIIFTDKQVIESESETLQNDIVALDSGAKVRVTVTQVTQTVKHVLIREFDPNKSYADGIESFS